MVGCGPQEEFRACADITISGKGATTTTEISVEPTAATPLPPTESTYSPIVSVVLSIMTFLATVLLLAVLYIYYYEVVGRIKFYLKGGSKKQKVIPVPPPRIKRRAPEPSDIMHNVNLRIESLA